MVPVSQLQLTVVSIQQKSYEYYTEWIEDPLSTI